MITDLAYIILAVGIILTVISIITTVMAGRRRAQELNSLRVIIDNVQQAAAKVRTACGEMATGSASVARGASDQAVQLLESSTSLEELRAMVGRSDENGIAANRLCGQVGRSVGDVRQAMNRLNEAVKEIQTRAQAVNGVLVHIREISTQTGLLAVNAGLEATRAGDAGRGFNVVANEVGQLANDARGRAQHIATLVSASRDSADLGAQLAKGVDQALQSTLGQMDEITRLVEAIVKAGREQARGMGEISKTVTEMDSVTQNTASSAEEMARNAAGLSQLADSLDQAVAGLSRVIGGDRSLIAATTESSRKVAVATFVKTDQTTTKYNPQGQVPKVGGDDSSSAKRRIKKDSEDDSFWGSPVKKSKTAASVIEDTDNGEFIPFNGHEDES